MNQTAKVAAIATVAIAVVFSVVGLYLTSGDEIQVAEPTVVLPPLGQTPPPPPAAITVKETPRQQADMSGIPRVCLEYKRRIISETRHAWGLDGYPSTFGAQIQQESACNPNAVSRVGAQGLAQFMPATSKWFGNDIMKETPAPLDPDWSIRAMVQYNLHLWDQVSAIDDCNRMAKTLSAYNGGLGWIRKDERLADKKGLDKDVWFDNVEAVNSGRSAANFKENRGYPRRIMLKIEPSYVNAGYGKGACHSGTL